MTTDDSEEIVTWCMYPADSRPIAGTCRVVPNYEARVIHSLCKDVPNCEASVQ
jgi:hypothetical protein